MKKINILQKELVSFYEELFKTERYFTIVYGSYAYEIETSESDLDIVTIAEEKSQSKLEQIVDFTIQLHSNFNLSLDNEVPLRNKLFASYSEMDSAIKGQAFDFSDTTITIPPIKKTKEFLESENISLRLLLNAITSKNIFISGNVNDYANYKVKGMDFITKLILLTNNKTSISINDFVNLLIYDKMRNEGELYLGYKDSPKIKKFLTESFETHFKYLEDKNLVKKQDLIYRFNKNWIKSPLYDL